MYSAWAGEVLQSDSLLGQAGRVEVSDKPYRRPKADSTGAPGEMGDEQMGRANPAPEAT
ncbi:hypothetical protein GCM10009745_71340 [Kribbella yunnanensis]|uniref:Transposase n=1 Tax=Kribbella yunnanensis TaxID=190194 RepID=A0ABN2IVX1_9ACTN